jgi:hypothetical protein
MDLPSWVTQQNLGTYSQDYSFDLNPIIITFAAGPANSVRLINGSLPTGLSWSKVNNTVVIIGVAQPSFSDINARFTLRITQSNGAIADRTFYLTLTALAQAPSWLGQDTFLGYQSNSEIGTYQLVAIPPQGQHVTYSLLSAPIGMTINSITGLLSYDANAIVSNSTVLFNVLATGSTAGSDIDLTIDVVIPPSNPQWVTGSGSLGTFAGEDFIEINLEATDVTGATVTYMLTSSDPEFPLTLDSDGFLYGRVPNPVFETLWSFTVSATSVNGSVLRIFSISVVPSALYSLLTWISDSNLGIINEAEYVEIPIKATTRRNSPLIYNVTGGLLPPHLMIDRSQGTLVGYCEFTAVDKIYNFDVSVTDGYQTITKTFSISVKKRYGDQFFGAYIPLTGFLRQDWQGDAANVRVREPGTRNFSTITNPVDPPYMNIINGIVTGYETADQIVSNVMPWFHTLDLQLGSVNNSTIQTDGMSTLYRHIVDAQQGANLTVYSQAVYNTNVETNGIVYPISIENLRQAFAGTKTYVTGGSGTGAVLSPVLDWSTGAVTDVNIISSGQGYLIPPQVTVNGLGTGAVIQAILGVVSIKISGSGRGWSVGDQIAIPGIANTYASVSVVNVGVNGSIVAARLSERGDYRQVSSQPSLYVAQGDAYAYISPTWGVVSTRVINGGQDYQCGINLSCRGTEILPNWQLVYFPMMEIGDLPYIVAGLGSELLNTESSTLWGIPWDPNYIVFQWQGIKWLGTTSFDFETTTFDGDTTRFQETEDAKITIFDEDQTIFNENLTTFDYNDPLTYDLQQVWGSTLIDQGTTVFDLYATIFDQYGPRTYSNTRLRKWIAMQNRVYSGNNVVI